MRECRMERQSQTFLKKTNVFSRKHIPIFFSRFLVFVRFFSPNPIFFSLSHFTHALHLILIFEIFLIVFFPLNFGLFFKLSNYFERVAAKFAVIGRTNSPCCITRIFFSDLITCNQIMHEHTRWWPHRSSDSVIRKSSSLFF